MSWESEKRWKEANIREEIWNGLKGNLPAGEGVYLGSTSRILIDAGADDLPLLYGPTHLRMVVLPFDSEKHHHGMSAAQIARVAEKLKNPLFIIDSNRPDSITVCINELAQGTEEELNCPVLVNIHLNGTGVMHGHKVRTNYITGIYGKRREGAASMLQKAIKDNRLIYADVPALKAMFKAWDITIYGIDTVKSGSIVHTSDAAVKTAQSPDKFNERYHSQIELTEGTVEVFAYVSSPIPKPCAVPVEDPAVRKERRQRQYDRRHRKHLGPVKKDPELVLS